MNKKLSFIVPFYNVEKYIASCLDSLYAQDIPLDEFEVICIDDCSPDGSIDIVREYQLKYQNLKLIMHDVNRGLGAGRNTGLQHAQGNYVWFIDSDDFIKPGTLSVILSELSDSITDVLCFNYSRVNKQGELIEELSTFEKTKIYNGVNFVKNVFSDSFVYHLGYVWRTILRKDYLVKNNIVFPEKVYWEDTVFFPKSLLSAENIKAINLNVYCYRDNSESISGNKNRYKHDRIYQFAFIAGWDLLKFSSEFAATDMGIAQNLEKKAIWYFNSFPKPLSLSTWKEKKLFYNTIAREKEYLKNIIPYLNFISKLCLKPLSGLILCNLIKPIYVFKEKSKEKQLTK